MQPGWYSKKKNLVHHKRCSTLIFAEKTHDGRNEGENEEADEGKEMRIRVSLL